MSRTWRKIPALLRTQSGRRRLRRGVLARSNRLIRPLALAYRRTLIRRVRIVAVVGTFGKTTTARAIAAALGLPVERCDGWNAGAFVSRSLLRIPPWSRGGVIEVAIHQRGEMARYARLIRPHIAVVTSIGSEHGTSLGSLEHTREEKAMMVRALSPAGLAVLNADDPHVRWMRSQTQARTVTYGFRADNELRAEDVQTDEELESLFSFVCGGVRHHGATRLIGRHMIGSILAAVAVAADFGVEARTVLARTESLSPTPERLELVHAPVGASLLVDTFKSHLETIHSALTALEGLPARRKLVVLGGVEEPPGSQGPIYREIGRRLAGIAAHVVFVGGRKEMSPLSAGATDAGMPRTALHFAGRSPRTAVEQVRSLLRPGDLVLIKGRATQKLVRVAFALEGRAVACDLPFCPLQPGCRECDRLAGRPRARRMETAIRRRAQGQTKRSRRG